MERHDVQRLVRFPYRAGRALARRGLQPLNHLRPRRLDVCCCGLSKTGTHSLAGIFEGYRSAHHPDAELRLRLATEAFAQVPVGSLRTDRAWLFRSAKRHQVLATLDASYVQDTADRHSGSLMTRFFPDVSWREPPLEGSG